MDNRTRRPNLAQSAKKITATIPTDRVRGAATDAADVDDEDGAAN